MLLSELVGWTIRWSYIRPLFDLLTFREAALSRAGERSTAALSQLKGTSERTREEIREKTGEKLQRIAQEEIGQVSPPSTAKRKFEAGEKDAAKPVGDIGEALGGAKAGEQFVEKKRPPGPGGEGDQAKDDATSRLLEAKRRARKGMEDKQE